MTDLPITCRLCSARLERKWRLASTYSNEPDYLILKCLNPACRAFRLEFRASTYQCADVQARADQHQAESAAFFQRVRIKR